MPISTLISLIPETDVTLRPTMGHQVHAALLAILRESDPRLAETLHAPSTLKPFTVSPIIAKAKTRARRLHIRAGTDCRLRFTFLEDTLFKAFGNAFLKAGAPSIRLGSATFHLKQFVSQTTADQHWSGNATYSDLAESATAEPEVRLKFHSPTAFRALTPRGQKSYNHTQVDPVRCYQSWLNKWNAFAPMPIDKTGLLEFVETAARVSLSETRTQALDFRKHTEIGWVGTCTFQFGRENGDNTEFLRTVNCLADFAFYCGTGYKTTMGMGQTQRI